MPNLTGVSARPFAQNIAACLLNSSTRLAAVAIVARRLELLDDVESDIVFDLHAIRRHIAAVAIEIALAHIERIETEPDRDRIHHALG